MKIFLFSLLSLFYFNLFSQVATSNPTLPFSADELTITFDVSKGSGTLEGYTGDVYVHTGVLTDKSSSDSDWKYVLTDWGVNTSDTKLTRIGDDLYEYIITPSIREFYDVPVEEIITHLAFVLRSGEKVSESYLECKDQGGKDIFVEIFQEGFQVSVVSPSNDLLSVRNTDIAFEAVSTKEAELSLFLNDDNIKTVTGISIIYNFNFSDPGDYWLKVKAEKSDEILYDSVFIHILADEIEEALPEGNIEGFNQTSPTSGILVLFAPYKEHVFVIGDFNDFTPSSNYRMKREGDYFWLKLEDLIAEKEYAYQYLVDGEIKIADPYTHKILDPWNDKYISETTYPDLIEYPYSATDGIASVFQTEKPEYNWSEKQYSTPDQSNLIIYELLLRDFVATHDWKTLTDTLNYFSSLGINAIELMPFNEFEGNESWGYNPSFYFAPDKYYGPANDLKEFIDSCHNRGIAVIMDMVLNHSYGQSPFAQLYWNDESSRPASNNPWYNETSPNTSYAWGNDFNHESLDTKKLVDRINSYWLEEYNIDGFRFDFTKGFTNTSGDGWAYDSQRIAILKRMADSIWSVKSDAYVILEHFADNSEEKVLANYGMMIWGNLNAKYNEATMGWNESGKSDFSWASYEDRQWSEPNLVTYMESHDEERLMFKNISYGNSFEDYNIQNKTTALRRNELAAAFFITIPGPKMIWQFGEMGYDYSIDYNERIGNKPIRWDYLNSRNRIFKVYSYLNKLKLTEPAFSTDDYTLSVAGALKRIELNHEDMDVRIIGNFDVKTGIISANFSKAGNWYDYYSGDKIEVTDVDMQFELIAGEYHIFTSKVLETPELPTGEVAIKKVENVQMFPNPTNGKVYLKNDQEINKVRLFDLRGRLVQYYQPGEREIELDLTELDSGYYFVQIEIESSLKTLKLIKQ